MKRPSLKTILLPLVLAPIPACQTKSYKITGPTHITQTTSNKLAEPTPEEAYPFPTYQDNSSEQSLFPREEDIKIHLMRELEERPSAEPTITETIYIEGKGYELIFIDLDPFEKNSQNFPFDIIVERSEELRSYCEAKGVTPCQNIWHHYRISHSTEGGLATLGEFQRNLLLYEAARSDLIDQGIPFPASLDEFAQGTH